MPSSKEEEEEEEDRPFHDTYMLFRAPRVDTFSLTISHTYFASYIRGFALLLRLGDRPPYSSRCPISRHIIVLAHALRTTVSLSHMGNFA